MFSAASTDSSNEAAAVIDDYLVLTTLPEQ